MSKIKIGVIGAAGYTAGELLRLLINHPNAEISYAQSGSNDGNRVASVHKDLEGECDLIFNDVIMDDVDLIFLCMGHGKSVEFISTTDIPESVKVIDLSHDFRLKREGNDFVYGLPELNKDIIKTAKHIANPGCFATGIQFAILPLASAGLLVDDIHVNAITGSTGAGQKPTGTSHYSWRNNNVSVYKAFNHQHLGEIGESVAQLQPGFNKTINFIPVRGNHTRGIYATAYTKFAGKEEEAVKIYKDFYAEDPFVTVVDYNPDLKQVVNTNKAILRVEKHGENIMIISCTDNLLKGASGQAVQNMNLMFNLEERTGLSLKPSAF